MKAANIAPDDARSPDSDWKSKMPKSAQFAAHNYNHLMEQPTIFYALMFTIFLMDKTCGMTLCLAWAYVALRVVHSLVQVTTNKVMIRFSLFSLSTLVLIAMVVATGLKLV